MVEKLAFPSSIFNVHWYSSILYSPCQVGKSFAFICLRRYPSAVPMDDGTGIGFLSVLRRYPSAVPMDDGTGIRGYFKFLNFNFL
jgi:hypothetical protein